METKTKEAIKRCPKSDEVDAVEETKAVRGDGKQLSGGAVGGTQQGLGMGRKDALGRRGQRKAPRRALPGLFQEHTEVSVAGPK